MAEVSLLKVLLHDEFKEWLTTLRDPRARAQVAVRLRRLELGNPGEFKPLGGGVTEMKINYGPGYRSVLHLNRDANCSRRMWRG